MDDLGVRRARYRRTDLPFLLVFGCGLWLGAAVAALVGWASRPLDGSDVAALVIMEVLMVPIGGLALFRSWLGRRDAVDLHEHGLVVHQHGFARNLRFDEIARIVPVDRERVTLLLSDGSHLEIAGSSEGCSVVEALETALRENPPD